jgi:hypothetical protein
MTGAGAPPAQAIPAGQVTVNGPVPDAACLMTRVIVPDSVEAGLLEIDTVMFPASAH